MVRTMSLLLVFVFGGSGSIFAGPYAPPVGEPNSTAIHMDDPNFVAWATGIVVQRGYIRIDNPGLGYVSYGSDANALGKADGGSYDVVTLGDGGTATLTFDYPIANKQGYDFAVFENAITDTFLELGYVEVSSDGINFFDFNSVSLTQTTTQVAGFGSVDTTDVNNLAGKYLQGYGTPFDLEELADVNSLLDVNYITHVRITDVVGCIQDTYARYDSQGNKINDPWPTPFPTGGFDLDAVGVIHEKILLADFDSNDVVNFSDYSIFANAYMSGPGDGNWNEQCDISDPNDDVIDLLDFLWFIDEWLNTM